MGWFGDTLILGNLHMWKFSRQFSDIEVVSPQTHSFWEVAESAMCLPCPQSQRLHPRLARTSSRKPLCAGWIGRWSELSHTGSASRSWVQVASPIPSPWTGGYCKSFQKRSIYCTGLVGGLEHFFNPSNIYIYIQIGNNHPNWLIFLRLETTNQIYIRI